MDRLLAAGHPVVAIHPGAFNAMRPRWGASRAKTDNADSSMLADLLRTDGRHLRMLAPTEPTTLELQALSRQRSDLVATRTSLTNQLRALLEAHSGQRLHPQTPVGLDSPTIKFSAGAAFTGFYEKCPVLRAEG